MQVLGLLVDLVAYDLPNKRLQKKKKRDKIKLFFSKGFFCYKF